MVSGRSFWTKKAIKQNDVRHCHCERLDLALGEYLHSSLRSATVDEGTVTPLIEFPLTQPDAVPSKSAVAVIAFIEPILSDTRIDRAPLYTFRSTTNAPFLS